MKYCCNKVKIGDFVYIQDDSSEYDCVCKYKVLAVDKGKIIVEVRNNEEDHIIIPGWKTDSSSVKMRYNLPSGVKAWFVHSWKKAERKCLNIE